MSSDERSKGKEVLLGLLGFALIFGIPSLLIFLGAEIWTKGWDVFQPIFGSHWDTVSTVVASVFSLLCSFLGSPILTNVLLLMVIFTVATQRYDR